MSDKGIAVITGASSGIGAAYARRLAERGYDLHLVARRGDRLQQLAEKLQADHQVRVETRVLDLVKPADVRALELFLVESPVTMLVNNAGAGGLGPTAKTGADAQEALISLNVVALARLSVAALGGFSARGTGALVNIASVVAFAPSAGGASYSGSKAFVLNFTRSLQMEYQKSGLSIQAVLPGPIRTEFFAAQGMDDSVFPDSAYISAEALVDAALNGLDQGEQITIPTLPDMELWAEMERLRGQFLGAVVGGTVGARYSANA